MSTRNSPVRSPHGGAREGSGRRAKENIPPRVNETKEHILEKYEEPKKTQDELNSDIKSLINPKGRSWSLEECKLILILILSLMYYKGTNSTDTINDVAKLIHRGTKTINTLFRIWRESKKVHVVDTTVIGTHIKFGHAVPTWVVHQIEAVIREGNTTTGGVTTTVIRSHLLDKLGVQIGKSSLAEVLHKMGYKYGEARTIGQMNDSRRRNRIKYFMLEYSAGLVKQTLGTHVMVYTDETYVNLAGLQAS